MIFFINLISRIECLFRFNLKVEIVLNFSQASVNDAIGVSVTTEAKL